MSFGKRPAPPSSSFSKKRGNNRIYKKENTTMTCLPFVADKIPAWPEGFQVPRPEQQPQTVVEQWIQQVIRYSSQYGSTRAWCASQVVGPPRVQRYGDNGDAWAPEEIGTEYEWLEVKVAQPVRIQAVRIHESLSGGAFTRLQLGQSAPNNNNPQFVTVVEQISRCGQLPPEIRTEEIHIPVPHQQMATDTLRLEFDPRGGSTWYEIDAILVIGTIESPLYQDRMSTVLPFVDRQRTLAESIATLWKDSTTADCTLVAVDSTTNNSNDDNRIRVSFPVHRGILASRCPLFRKWVENSELTLGGEMVVEGIQPGLLQQVLEWIYTGALDESWQETRTKKHNGEEADPRLNCVALIAASDYFLLDSLTEYCIEVFQSLLMVDNAAELYSYFDCLYMTSMKPLKQAALNFCAANFLEVSQTPAFHQLTQPQLLEIIECYRGHPPPRP